MLQQPIYSLFIRIVPEAFLIMYSICLLTNSKIDFKKIFISAIIGGTGVYIARLMPIHFGVHTILASMLNILLAVKINNIKMHRAIAGTMISVILIFISDILIVTIYANVFELSPDIIMGQSVIAVIASFPSLIIFYLIVRLIAYFKKIRWIKYEQD